MGLSLATYFAADADWLDAQEATRAKNADCNLEPLAGLKTSVWYSTVSVIDTCDASTKQGVTDIFSVVSAEGGSGAEVALRVQRFMLRSVMEFLFLRPNHWGMQFVHQGKCVLLPSVFWALSDYAAGPFSCSGGGEKRTRVYGLNKRHEEKKLSLSPTKFLLKWATTTPSCYAR